MISGLKGLTLDKNPDVFPGIQSFEYLMAKYGTPINIEKTLDIFVDLKAQSLMFYIRKIFHQLNNEPFVAKMVELLRKQTGDLRTIAEDRLSEALDDTENSFVAKNLGRREKFLADRIDQFLINLLAGKSENIKSKMIQKLCQDYSLDKFSKNFVEFLERVESNLPQPKLDLFSTTLLLDRELAILFVFLFHYLFRCFFLFFFFFIFSFFFGFFFGVEEIFQLQIFFFKMGNNLEFFCGWKVDFLVTREEKYIQILKGRGNEGGCDYLRKNFFIFITSNFYYCWVGWGDGPVLIDLQQEKLIQFLKNTLLFFSK